MKVLLTGFEPFGGETINPALEAVKLVPDKVDDIQVVKLIIPVVFGKAIDAVVAAMEREKPDAVICIGQAGGRFEVTPERVAINVDDGRIADNEGYQPIDAPIYKDGPTAYFSSLPIKAMVQAIRKEGLPSSVSNTAGTFVCNHVMYGVLYHIDRSYPGTRGGFIHVPYIPSQVVEKPGTPYMSLPDMAKALEIAVRVVGTHQTDISVAGGKEH